MNRIRSISAVLLVLAASCAWAQGPIYKVGVDGLACPFCAFGVEKQLQNLDGVIDLQTDIEEGHVIVEVQEGKLLREEQVKQAVKKAGFTLRSLSRADASR